MTRSGAESARPRQAVILAGGRGERMRPLSDTVPKHMIPVAGRPFLQHLLEQLRGEGFERFLILLGHLPQATPEYFGDGRRLGASIDYCATPPEWQTTRRLKQAMGRMDPVAGIFYCDNYAPLDFPALWRRWSGCQASAQVTVYDNRDGYSKNNIRVEAGGAVSVYDKSRQAPGLNGVEIGYCIVRRQAVEAMPAVDAPFETVLFPALAAEGRLRAFVTRRRYYGAGSPERLEQTRRYFENLPAAQEAGWRERTRFRPFAREEAACSTVSW